MVDHHQTTVCCMCGDVGFPDKLFRCTKCYNRFQHSYCSNYYGEFAQSIEVCDWCKSEEKTTLSPSSSRHGSSSRKPAAAASFGDARSAYSGDKIKQHHREDGAAGAAAENKGKNTASPRPSTRRYKLLKDVMC